MTQAIVKSTRQMLEDRLPKMLALIPESDKPRFQQAAMAVCLSPNLSECTQESIMSSIYYCFRWGIVPDPAFKQVYIIPFRDRGQAKAQPILGYNGLIDLARNADPSLEVRTGCVYANDGFTYRDGTKQELEIHTPHWLAGMEPGELLFSWCAYKTASQSEPSLVVVPAKTLNALRAKQGGRGFSPWADAESFPAMCEKTAIRRAAKKWSLAPHTDAGRKLREALSDDDRADTGELPDIDVSMAPSGADQPRKIGMAAVAEAVAGRDAATGRRATEADSDAPATEAARFVPSDAEKAQIQSEEMESVVTDAQSRSRSKSKTA
jgi:phage RecT family recombinase